ncbi:uncharacterized protein LOC119183986 isoform X2 [Rhipicephalus microplus]|uniref:uncharacterized protein LOC119183986 isoform X2 n=1 Tax=Rhipicephalus microplus TaxID=6941 RepID=UPI003F6AB5A4
MRCGIHEFVTDNETAISASIQQPATATTVFILEGGFHIYITTTDVQIGVKETENSSTATHSTHDSYARIHV